MLFGSTPLFDSTFCEHLPTGFYEYPYDCAAYISCSDSRTELEHCATGKLFNKDLQICDTPDAVDCIELQQPTTTTPDECMGVSNGTVMPSVEHCDEFIVCINQQAVRQKCSEPFLFNPALHICDDPSEVVCYDGQSTAKTTTEAPKPTTEAHNECQGHELGTSFPYVEDCQEYILCLGDDQSVKAKCPVNSWYDPKSGNCGPDVPPTACLEVETTSTTSSTTLSPHELCADQEFGISYPLVTNCKQYIVCLGNGESAVVNCIYNAWYNPVTGDCGQDVSPTACQEGSIPTTTTSPTTPATTQAPTTPTPTTDKPITELCSGLLHGQYVSYPDNCSKYVVCSEPVPIAFHCTPGYYFSEALQQCVDWDESDCETTGSTVWPPLPTPAPGICLNNAGSTLPYPENCQWYFRCVNDNVYMMGVCISGEFYDPYSGECGANVSPDACLENYSTATTDLSTTTTEMTTISTTISTTALTTTTAPITTISTTTAPQSDPCEGVAVGDLVPYPNDCTKFIQCNSPNPVVFDCVEGQEFSAQLKRCMAPWFANCTITPTTEAPLTSTTELPDIKTTGASPSPHDFCEGKTDGSLVPYPNNCSKYIVCQEPIAVGYACPDDEEFSPTELRCMDAQLANCTAQALQTILTAIQSLKTDNFNIQQDKKEYMPWQYKDLGRKRSCSILVK